MGHREPFTVDPGWSFPEFLEQLYSYYRGGGIQSTGYRLNTMRAWLSMAGRAKAMEALEALEEAAETEKEEEVAQSLWMSTTSYVKLKRFVRNLPPVTPTDPIEAFISYRWESGEHVAWVRKLAGDLRARGINAVLDQWEVRLGESFTTYMAQRIARADVILFVISPGAVSAAEAPDGRGGALQFEVQMMSARRIRDGVRIIGVYRAGDRPPNYLRDHKYVDFRKDCCYEEALQELVEDLQGEGGPPEIRDAGSFR